MQNACPDLLKAVGCYLQGGRHRRLSKRQPPLPFGVLPELGADAGHAARQRPQQNDALSVCSGVDTCFERSEQVLVPDVDRVYTPNPNSLPCAV